MDMGKLFRILASVLVIAICCCGCFGCGGSKTTGFDYDQYVKEQEELREQQCELWLYGDDVDRFSFKQYYNEQIVDNPANGIKTVEVLPGNMDYGQFQTKLQVGIMTGKGPDLVMTAQYDLFKDVDKIFLSGAFQSWDDYIADWDKDSYYTQALEGARASDGKLYLLPLAFNPYVIVIPKENMQKYHLTEDDFSDFGKTTDTLLRLWEEIKGDTSLYVHQNNPLFLAMIPSICDMSAGKTSLMEPKTQELLHKWEQIFAYKDERNKTASLTFGSANIFFDGSRILDWCSMAELIGMNLTPEQKEKLVFIPMYDINGKMYADVNAYALLPTNCKNPQAAADYVKYCTVDSDHDIVGNLIRLSRRKTESFFRVQECDMLIDEINKLTSVPMHLVVNNQIRMDYDNEILKTLLKDNPNWKDLETDINIYLSE